MESQPPSQSQGGTALARYALAVPSLAGVGVPLAFALSRNVAAKAIQRVGEYLVSKLSTEVGGQRRRVGQPPVRFHLAEKDTEERCREVLEDDRPSLPDSRLARPAGGCGTVLARAHSKSGDPAKFSGYLGKVDAFDQAIGEFVARNGINEVFANGVVVLVALIPFFAVRTFGRVLGRERIAAPFFRRRVER